MVIQFKVKESTLTQLSVPWVVSNSYNHVRAQFNFASDEWSEKKKTAIFMFNGREYPVDLDRNDSCRVPWEVLMPPQFYMYVVGENQNDDMISTNSCAIDVHPSVNGEFDVNSTAYQNIISILQQKQDVLTAGENITIDENDVISATCDCDGNGDSSDNDNLVSVGMAYYGTFITEDEAVIPSVDGFEALDVVDNVFRFTLNTETPSEFMYFFGPVSLGNYKFKDINAPFTGGWQELGRVKLNIDGQMIEYIVYKTYWDNLGRMVWEVKIV